VFVAAIERAAEFTRPLHVIFRYFGSTVVRPGTATLFFVNPDGWALTCRHVTEQFALVNAVNGRYRAFKAERAALGEKHRRHQVRDLERKYGLGKDELAELKFKVINCIDGGSGIRAIPHPTLDIALLKFQDFTILHCKTFPVFAREGGDLKQGMFLCRLGFPFPEFTNFAYDVTADAIDWTAEGRQDTPRFPIEGMVTRHSGPAIGTITGFELSTPGLRGQSGGPAFDAEGRVWGMQSETTHLDLDFDVDTEVARGGVRKPVKESAFLHVGRCVHVDALKAFMRENNVAFADG
jgi:hypothetical protein